MRHFHPRLRISLRTLFVLVTICGSGLGLIAREWRTVQQRHAFMQRIWEEGEDFFQDPTLPREHLAVRWSEDANSRTWIRRWMGDHDRNQWAMYRSLNIADRQELERLFPKAEIEHDSNFPPGIYTPPATGRYEQTNPRPPDPIPARPQKSPRFCNRY